MFQHTATRRWLPSVNVSSLLSRFRFNTQPPEGGCNQNVKRFAMTPVSTHSHPKVAAVVNLLQDFRLRVSTHSHPKVAAQMLTDSVGGFLFQHTATRRWLLVPVSVFTHRRAVSTHSHPKVAAPYIKKQEESVH